MWATKGYRSSHWYLLTIVKKDASKCQKVRARDFEADQPKQK